MLSLMRWRDFTRLLILLLILAPASLTSGRAEPPGDGTLRRIRVPVLMYHYVDELPPDADDIRRDLTIAPAVFEAHLQYLADQGYSTITLYQLYDALMYGAPLPPRPVVLTFDDGYADHYTHVFPALQKHGFVGTFFIITGRADAGDPAYLNWEQIREMAQAGMNMEPHTKSHMSLASDDRNFLIYEMLGSQESLAAHTGTDVRMLSYPAGRYDDQTLQIAQELGFSLAVTTQPGMHHVSSRPLELPRVRVNGSTSAAGLAYLLHGAWLVSGG